MKVKGNTQGLPVSGPDTVRQLLEAVVVVVVVLTVVVVVDAVVAVVELVEVVVEVVEEVEVVVEHEFVVQTWHKARKERYLMIVTR